MYLAMKMVTEPSRYDNKSGRWMDWINGAWNVDCCRMIKGFLWGFSFDRKANHGGAVWKLGFPDYTTEQMIEACRDVSTNMAASSIQPGELLWMPGHVGLYAGDGNVIEAAPSLKGAALTRLNYQKWQKHGFIREVEYSLPTPAPAPEPEKPYAGEQVNVNKEPLFASSSRKEPANHITGRFFLTDGKVIRGRVRISKQVADVGKIDRVLGWIDWRDDL